MSDQTADRIFKPTANRRKQARMRGQVARSADLVSVVTAAAAMGGLLVAGPSILAALKDLLAGMLDTAAARTSLAGAQQTLHEYLPGLLTATGLLVGLVVLAAVAVNLVQVGPAFSLAPLRPDVSRLSPWRNLRRAASGRAMVRLGMTLLKAAALAAVAWVNLPAAIERLSASSALAPAAMLGEAASLLGGVLLQALALLTALAVLDWLYQRWQHERDLKMTRREYTEDLRQTQGDVAARARHRNERRRELAAGPRAAAAIAATADEQS
jgi:flagellar biosynthetic protein FlhB